MLIIIELPNEPEITHAFTKTCAQIFIIIHSIPKVEKSKCLSTDEWVDKMCYRISFGNKRNEELICAKMQTNLTNFLNKKKTDTNCYTFLDYFT
jgi:hypothetical protein